MTMKTLSERTVEVLFNSQQLNVAHRTQVERFARENGAPDASAAIEQAVADNVLVELGGNLFTIPEFDEEARVFGVANERGDAPFKKVRSDVGYPGAFREHETWAPVDGKRPYFPWGNEGEKHMWSLEENLVRFEFAQAGKRSVEFTDGVAFIQTERDDFLFVDMDDIRDPATGAVHPVAEAVFHALGNTFACVSGSEKGIHAYYRLPGENPLDGKQCKPAIDYVPFVGEDCPKIEMYFGSHVVVTTGEKFTATSDSVRDVNRTGLRNLIKITDGESLQTEAPQFLNPGATRPSSSSPSKLSDDDEITAREVEELLGKISADVDMKTWITVLYGLRNWGRTSKQGSETEAKRLAKKWSKTGSKWGDESASQLEYVFNDDSGGKSSIGSVIYLAHN